MLFKAINYDFFTLLKTCYINKFEDLLKENTNKNSQIYALRVQEINFEGNFN